MKNSNLIKLSTEGIKKNINDLEKLSSKEFAHEMFNASENEKNTYFNYLLKQSKEFRNEVGDYLKEPKEFLYL